MNLGKILVGIGPWDETGHTNRQKNRRISGRGGDRNVFLVQALGQITLLGRTEGPTFAVFQELVVVVHC